MNIESLLFEILSAWSEITLMDNILVEYTVETEANVKFKNMLMTLGKTSTMFRYILSISQLIQNKSQDPLLQQATIAGVIFTILDISGFCMLLFYKYVSKNKENYNFYVTKWLTGRICHNVMFVVKFL